jgi:hypothetical protein
MDVVEFLPSIFSPHEWPALVLAGVSPMYHTLEFAVEFTADLEISPKHYLERLLIERGTQLRAQIKPYVLETEDGLVEVADLFFEDGTATRQVPFEYFTFVN